MASAERRWRIFKADQEAEYKQLPLRLDGQQFAIIPLRRPESGSWFGFRPRTLLFGAIAAV